MNFSKIAILGPGLLGGSIGLVLQERFPSIAVALWARRTEAVLEARKYLPHATTELQEAITGADLVVLCVPVGSMAELARQILPFLAQNAVVTDVGSVKGIVLEQLTPIFHGRARFVGSHPMAGSEKTGFAAAHPNLFDGAVCILTPEGDTDAQALGVVGDFWENIGCTVRRLPPRIHDETVALVSHLPHFLAANLVDLVRSRAPEAFEFCGPGFRDTTRVASGSPEMWAEIFSSNRLALKTSAEAMIEKLQQIVKLIDQPEAMRSFLAGAKAQRDKIRLHH